MHASIQDWSNNLDASIEIPRHPIRRSEIQFLISVIREIVDPRMLQKTSDDADDSDPLADTLDSGSEAADSSNYQVDFHSRLRCFVQVLDDLRVDERVHFRDDPGGLAL